MQRVPTLSRTAARAVTVAELVVGIAMLLVGLAGIHHLLSAADAASGRLLRHSMAASRARAVAEEMSAVPHATWMERLSAGAGTWAETRWEARERGGYVLRGTAVREEGEAIRLDAVAWWSSEQPDPLATARRPAEAVASTTFAYVLPPAPAMTSEEVGRARAVMMRDIPTPTPPPTPTPTPTPRATRGFGRPGAGQ